MSKNRRMTLDPYQDYIHQIFRFIIQASIYELNVNIISVLAIVKFINHFTIIIKYICWFLYFQQKTDCKTGEWHNEGDLKMTLEHKNGFTIITTLLISITVLMYLYYSYPHKLDIKLIYPSYNIEGIIHSKNIKCNFFYHSFIIIVQFQWRQCTRTLKETFILSIKQMTWYINPYNFKMLINLSNSGRYMYLPK